MAEDEEYELLPRREIEYLKKELEKLKKNPLGELKEGQTLLDSVNNLNNNIKKLIDIFAKADSDLAKEYSENNPAESLNIIKAQNEHIAQGLLTLADVLREMKESKEPTRPAPGYQNQMPQQNMGFGMPQGMPPPDFPSQIPNPPPPPFDLSAQPQGQFQQQPMPPPPERKGFFRR